MAKPLQTALSSVLLAFGVGMVSLMMLSEKQIKDQFERNIKDIDIVLSPSRPFVLASGDLDGAPNVANVEAGVAGVAIFITDELDQCTEYRSGEELEIIPSEPITISNRILHYFKNPQKLYKLARRGQNKMALVHGYERQIKPRLSLLNNLLHE